MLKEQQCEMYDFEIRQNVFGGTKTTRSSVVNKVFTVHCSICFWSVNEFQNIDSFGNAVC